eukprot:TRINITY_DN1655_c0_g1_i1.p1 TRINITY_DN1655_c0_g1~~TRINITY_DN1655_c0_g1_i1.p1  ORF type:complete len:360 (-),score=150.73 TRINITY_DN1655_c0_g1_i1:118-1197(-)
MPPKEKVSKKSDAKARQKSVEDKTFGLKNKNKSKKVEAYVKSVEQQSSNRPADRKAEAMAQQRKDDKAKAEAAKREMEILFKPVINQTKVPVGVDPKSILCEYYKQGSCAKGAKCKYSHDLNISRKVEKIDIYSDRRDDKAETMENWDEAKLQEVVGQKQTATNRNIPTKIICKHFLEAIEQKKYGWFWECPDGGDACKYVHALPPGFVLKKKKDEDEEEEEPISLEEQIEEQRRQLVGGTPVTLETFKKWKEDKRKKKEDSERAAEEKRQADIKAGRTQMSGREMFVFNPEMFVDDDEAVDDDAYEREDDIVAPDMDDDGQTGYLGNDDDTTTTTTSTSTDAGVDASLFAEEDIPDDA